MLNRLLNSLPKHIDALSKKWTHEILASEHMNNYKKLSKEQLEDRAKKVYENLIDWIEKGAENVNAEKYFEHVGVERLNEGFPLIEVYYAIYLTKKVLLKNLNELIESEPDKIFAKQVEDMTILSNFFDLGNFYLIRGYIREAYKRIYDTKKISPDELNKIIYQGDLYKEEIDDDFIWRHV